MSTNEDGGYIPRVVNQRGISFEELLREMENNTVIRKQDLRLAITQFATAISENLCKGLKVQTPVADFRPSIKGAFEAVDEDFRPFSETTNHELRVSVRPNSDLEDYVVKNIKAEKVMEHAVRYPNIISIENVTSPEGDIYHSSDILIMRGMNLKFDPEAEDEGVFWTNIHGEKTKASIYSINTKSNIHFQIPQLEAGTYTVEVATRLGNHMLRDAQLEEQLTIS